MGNGAEWVLPLCCLQLPHTPDSGSCPLSAVGQTIKDPWKLQPANRRWMYAHILQCMQAATVHNRTYVVSQQMVVGLSDNLQEGWQYQRMLPLGRHRLLQQPSSRAAALGRHEMISKLTFKCQTYCNNIQDQRANNVFWKKKHSLPHLR